jgi:hypothetical protein
MYQLANYYSENKADFIIVVCQIEEKKYKNNKLIRSICQKANGICYIKSNYVYWNLVVYLCWGIRAFRLHTESPEARLEDFDRIRKIFPRNSNNFLEIIETISSENEDNTVLDSFMSREGNLKKLKEACTGYFYIITEFGKDEKINKLKELHHQLCNITKDDQFFLTVFELKTAVNMNSMFTVLTYSQDSY